MVRKLLAVADSKTGKLAARCWVRIVVVHVNNDERKPESPQRPEPMLALHMDRIYQNPGYGTVVESVMRECFKQFAKNLEVATVDELRESGLDVRLELLGGPAPWEYIDAAGGLKENGKASFV